jgi:sec-independent protein translocase protein TatA
MPNIGPLEIVGLLILALLLFGAKRLPEIGRSLGSGMREFKDSVSGNSRPEEPAELPVSTELPASTTHDTTAHSPERENESVH